MALAHSSAFGQRDFDQLQFSSQLVFVSVQLPFFPPKTLHHLTTYGVKNSFDPFS
jgi:hypothetical protein